MNNRTKEEWIDIIVRSFGRQNKTGARAVAHHLMESLMNEGSRLIRERIYEELCMSCASNIPARKENGLWVHGDEIVYNCEAHDIREINL